MRTAWGYDVDGELPPLLGVECFQTMTGGRFGIGPEVESALAAASQAVRSACGWHICPPLDCTAKVTAVGKMAKLPAAYVSEVETVKERDPHTGDWATLTIPGEVEWRHDGLLRRRCFRNFSPMWDGVEVEYTAGFEPEAVPDLAQAVAGIAEGVLSLPRGVASESADGVAVTYTASAQSVAGAMTSQFRAQLAPYRVVSANAV